MVPGPGEVWAFPVFLAGVWLGLRPCLQCSWPWIQGANRTETPLEPRGEFSGMHSHITSAVLTVNRVSRCLAYRTETPARHTFRGICTETRAKRPSKTQWLSGRFLGRPCGSQSKYVIKKADTQNSLKRRSIPKAPHSKMVPTSC